MPRRAHFIACCLLVGPVAGCGSLAHLAPPGFSGAKPAPTDPKVEVLIEAEREGVRRGFRPLAGVPNAPQDLPTQEWAETLRGELDEEPYPPVSEEGDGR